MACTRSLGYFAVEYYEQTVDILLANIDKLELIYKEVEKTGVLSGARLSFMLGDSADNE